MQKRSRWQSRRAEQVRSVGTVENRADAVERVLRKLGKPQELKVCYEAGPTGYALYWQLTALGFECEVIAPSLAPSKPGDRVKTDRRDAERLARSYQAGDLTAVWVPDSRHEALRDLVRLRAAAKEDEKRAKHRLGKYLLRYGQRPGGGVPSVERGVVAMAEDAATPTSRAECLAARAHRRSRSSR
jgi:transposase